MCVPKPWNGWGQGGRGAGGRRRQTCLPTQAAHMPADTDSATQTALTATASSVAHNVRQCLFKAFTKEAEKRSSPVANLKSDVWFKGGYADYKCQRRVPSQGPHSTGAFQSCATVLPTFTDFSCCLALLSRPEKTKAAVQNGRSVVLVTLLN